VIGLIVLAAVACASSLALRGGRTRPPPASPATPRNAAAEHALPPPAELAPVTEVARVDDFVVLVTGNRALIGEAITRIDDGWHRGSTALLVECLPHLGHPQVVDWILALLERKTGQRFGADLNAWYQWIWRQPYTPHPAYAAFKAEFYSMIDPRFREYFLNADAKRDLIRLDEIRWGGVRRDGIPPLKDPLTTPASQATYLSDSDTVFGVELAGDAVAYPKRILAWHEMVKDVVGGESINGVYCTLCGSMIVYRTQVESVHHELGTSGFLYRSNKLMYDHATKSLWSTLDGQPVVGLLVGQGIKLQPLFVVTTTWRRWREDHPQTRVLSLETGHRRDYGEGVAYRDYFATDDLMFGVPELDRRLRNKAEVLAIRLDEHTSDKLAIAAEFLADRPVYHDQLGDVPFVVLTDETGANRVYETGGRRFTAAGNRLLTGDDHTQWQVTEAGLVARDGRATLRRLPAHRAFWFGWYAAFPATRLVP
jgi:hypothetical protein